MRLGGPLFETIDSPESWVQALRNNGYRAATCPVGPEADDDTVRAYKIAARDADIVIAEVGAWSNPLSSDPDTRSQAMEKCIRGLELADRIGALCCVNTAGSRGTFSWYGPDPANLTEETFEMIVETTRKIIDAVRPTRSVFTLEPMPWIFPDSPANYLRLIEAIDRPAFGVHLDPVNMINSPAKHFDNAALLRECFHLLGDHIRCCHAKDLTIGEGVSVQFEEVRPGLGALDYRTFLSELNKLNRDIPVMLEHLPSAEEYRLAAEYIRSVAAQEGISL
jgi:sugar phosphate isomerase/epimerase